MQKVPFSKAYPEQALNPINKMFPSLQDSLMENEMMVVYIVGVLLIWETTPWFLRYFIAIWIWSYFIFWIGIVSVAS